MKISRGRGGFGRSSASRCLTRRRGVGLLGTVWCVIRIVNFGRLHTTGAQRAACIHLPGRTKLTSTLAPHPHRADAVTSTTIDAIASAAGLPGRVFQLLGSLLRIHVERWQVHQWVGFPNYKIVSLCGVQREGSAVEGVLEHLGQFVFATTRRKTKQNRVK